MMRVCHLNTCPVGIATQDPELRERFAGKPEEVVRFFTLLAEDVRVIMASLGIARFADLVGRVDLLRVDRDDHWKASGLDLTPLLAAGGDGERCSRPVTFRPEAPIDEQMIAALPRARLELPISNRDRTVGGMLSGEIVRRGTRRPTSRDLPRLGGAELRRLAGAGRRADRARRRQRLRGQGPLRRRDRGAARSRRPRRRRRGRDRREHDAVWRHQRQAFFRGWAGERFAVRNSGADAVVEGVGDHGCEYMTGGHVVVLGPTGRNFAAGMSGGIAYVLDPDGDFASRCNQTLVGLEALDAEDRRRVYALLLEHRERTGSRAAAAVLSTSTPRRWSRSSRTTTGARWSARSELAEAA